MDGHDFDDLVKRLTQTRLSRFDVVRGLLASVAVGLTGASLAEETAAKKHAKASRKKGKAGKKKHHGKRAHGAAQDTVLLCHKGQTLEVAEPAVRAHLGHGDTLGPCGDSTSTTVRPGPGGPSCLPNGSTCTRDNQCCGNNCFNFVCADKVSQCTVDGTPLTCSPLGTGCCANDVDCCAGPDTQCNLEGLCCAPNCAGRQCGGDGCGGVGTCGSCPPGATCDEATGQCSCSPASCPGCCGPNGTCQPGTTEQACGTGGAPCVNCPGAGTTCQNGQCVCVPHCQGNQCGPDGCGGSCGTCPPGATCTAQGHCQCPTCPGPQVCCGDGSCKAPLGGQCGGDSDCCAGQTCCQGTCRLPAGGSGCTSDAHCCSRAALGPVCCGGTCCFSCEACNLASNTCVGDPAPGCPCLSQSCPSGQVCCGEQCCVSGRQCCGGQCKVPNEC